MAAGKAKIQKISIVDQVSNVLKNNIVQGVWKIGEKIPSETELAEDFGVNRLSVRMALQKLNTLGIIETKVGEGSFVRKFSLVPVFDEVDVFYSEADKEKDIREMRNLIEVECTRIAACSSTEEDREALKQCLDDYFEKKEAYMDDLGSVEKLEALVSADLNFHLQIVRMGHNQLYNEIYYMVQKTVRGHIKKLAWERLHNPSYDFSVMKDRHQILYEGICEGNADISKEALHEIIRVKRIDGVD